MTDTSVPGSRIIDVPVPPNALPAVHPDDLVAAWNAATVGAELGLTSGPGETRGIRFRRPDGGEFGIVFADIDVTCWVIALERAIGLDSLHGLAVCFRLLGLIDLMASASWTRDFYSVGGEDGPDIDPALLRAAARQPLDDDARFDPAAFRARAKLERGPRRIGQR